MKSLLSAEVISAKFVLREIITFFLQKRLGAVGDEDIIFTNKELMSFIKEKKSVIIKTTDIKSYLNYLKNFNRRDEKGKEFEPHIKLLGFRKNKNGVTTIKDCSTDNLKNALRAIDISIYLKGMSEDYEEKSLFEITQDGKLKFMDRISENPLRIKERAIFFYLRDNFNKECDYKDLFRKANEAQRASGNSLYNDHRTASDKKTYINNGITQLRTKIIDISGNPYAIETIKERTSRYRLIY